MAVSQISIFGSEPKSLTILFLQLLLLIFFILLFSNTLKSFTDTGTWKAGVMGANIDRKISSINWAPRKKLIKSKGHFANILPRPLVLNTTLKIKVVLQKRSDPWSGLICIENIEIWRQSGLWKRGIVSHQGGLLTLVPLYTHNYTGFIYIGNIEIWRQRFLKQWSLKEGYSVSSGWPVNRGSIAYT